ncbi:MAG: hypothetical protein N2385_14120 [Chloroflexus sp.]|nr:hypothetical protein [Chloroflexus sp.]
MATTSRELQPARRIQATGRIVRGIVTILAVAALAIIMGAIAELGRTIIDDWRYGRPRTTHLTGYAGLPAERAGQPSRFIAMNLDRQVVVIVLPGGDPAQAQTWQGPYLFGLHEDLTPVVLSLADADGDGLADLLVTIHHEQLVYLNRDGTFRLPTPEEWHRLAQERSK